ncbi:hypothetical protein HHK36_006108 [Tetracentron sinense]|uniref:BAH domain-containing protein n=1 Tax=Tetracentron sinense TaxID=13715 RepID=A0A834ZR95_TETSI|nr:hypothetical protein HHK36_006108 [Tetracentron sinense]
MHAMPHSGEAGKEYNPEFKWGKKKGAVTNTEVQFYESFTYDGVEYFLYDCVYLYYGNESKPSIGKLVKIWEQSNHKKRVKVVWFFLPCEILNWLGDDAPLENEIFLASGEGEGLSNVNPLEVLAGKCNVVCTSKDQRNLLPSELELRMAKYIFYRTFDVGSLTISDKFEDRIAGIEGQKLVAVPKENWKEKTGKLKLFSKLDLAGRLGDAIKDENHGRITSPVVKVAESKKTTASGRDREWFSDEILLRPKTHFDKEGTEAGEITRSQIEDKLEFIKNVSHLGALEKRPLKKMKLFDDSAKRSKELDPSPQLALGKDSETNAMWKSRVGFKESEKFSKPFKRPPRRSDYKAESKAIKDFVRQERGLSEKLYYDDKATKLSDKGAPELARDKGIKTDSQVLDVIRGPDVPWEERMRRSHEQGTLVLLENLDPSYSSTDIEDIVWHAFKERVTAKMIQRNTFSSPNYGQAFVIFKSRDAAEAAVTKLNKEFLMLPNGSPLVGGKGTPMEPGKPTKFVGHLFIEKFKLQKQRDEMVIYTASLFSRFLNIMRNAVSTSHYPQPNTIEYEMAMEWRLLQKKSDLWWEALHMKHREELKYGRRHLQIQPDE